MTLRFAAEARGVSKSFAHIKVLHDVSVAIPVGDARALVGRNGAGKSMRDGRVVAESPLCDLSKDRLVAAMVGTRRPRVRRRANSATARSVRPSASKCVG